MPTDILDPALFDELLRRSAQSPVAAHAPVTDADVLRTQLADIDAQRAGDMPSGSGPLLTEQTDLNEVMGNLIGGGGRPSSAILSPRSPIRNPKSRQRMLDVLQRSAKNLPAHVQKELSDFTQRYPRLMAHFRTVSTELPSAGVTGGFAPAPSTLNDPRATLHLNPKLADRSAARDTLAHEATHGAQAIRLADRERNAPSAEFFAHQPGVAGDPGFDLYHIMGGPRDRSTVSASTLQELGIPVPPSVKGATSKVSADAYLEPRNTPFMREYNRQVEEAGGRTFPTPMETAARVTESLHRLRETPMTPVARLAQAQEEATNPMLMRQRAEQSLRDPNRSTVSRMAESINDAVASGTLTPPRQGQRIQVIDQTPVALENVPSSVGPMPTSIRAPRGRVEVVDPSKRSSGEITAAEVDDLIRELLKRRR